jgi:hypothetical protein
MYPDDSGGGEGPPMVAPAPARFGRNLEGFIPIVIIILIAFFLAVKFGVISSHTPLIGGIAGLIGSDGPKKMLLIGESSQELRDVITANFDLVHLSPMSAENVDRNPREIISNYDIILLDQSEQNDKLVSRRLGEAIQDYVTTGGKLIVVLDSGIYRPKTYDVIGWEATFGDVVPVLCSKVGQGKHTCLDRMYTRGQIFSSDFSHPIMKGIEVSPALETNAFNLDFLDVPVNGKEIAYIKSVDSGRKMYPAIVEKKLMIGKSIYFNYNPGYTRGIFENTLKYLVGR